MMTKQVRHACTLIGAYALLAVVFTWPLALHLDAAVTSLVDPVDSIWRIGWGQYRLLHAPWQLFAGNAFYPYQHSYLFDELVLGPAILTLPLAALGVSPLAIYNIAVLLAFTLCGVTMYLLARRFGAIPLAAALAGVVYAFAPMHLERIGHIGVLSAEWFPLILLLIDRVIERPRARDTLVLAACLVMQAVSSQYHAIYLLVLVPLFLVVMLVRRREARRRPVLTHLAAAGIVALTVVFPIALGYRAVQTEYAVHRSFGQVTYYSASLASFVTTGDHNCLWGPMTAALRMHGTYTFERGMFPGALALLLAMVGVWVGRRRAWEQFLALLVLTSGVFALGPQLRLVPGAKSVLIGYLPYALLYWHLPGWDSMRVPARFGALFLLGIAGLAATGLTAVSHRLATIRLSPARLTRVLPIFGSAVILLGTGGEYLNHPLPLTPLESGAAIPPVYHWLATQPDARILELPLFFPDHAREQRIAAREQYFSLVHHHPLVNGNATVLPKGYQALVKDLSLLPSPRAVGLLQGLGITHIVVHYDQFTESENDRNLTDRLRAEQDGFAFAPVARFGETTVYQVAPTARFEALRAALAPHASVLLSREDPRQTGAYMAMLGFVLRDHPLYSHVRASFGQEYRGPPQANARYDYAILFVQEDPATAAFTEADIIWQDSVVRVYGRHHVTSQRTARDRAEVR